MMMWMKDHLPIHQLTDSATLCIYVLRLMHEDLCEISMNTILIQPKYVPDMIL